MPVSSIDNRRMFDLYFALMFRAIEADDLKTAKAAMRVLAKRLEWGK